MKISELRDLSVDELIATLKERRKDVFELRTENKRSTKVEEPHLIREHHKEIARILTLLRQKQTQKERK